MVPKFNDETVPQRCQCPEPPGAGVGTGSDPISDGAAARLAAPGPGPVPEPLNTSEAPESLGVPVGGRSEGSARPGPGIGRPA
eukprot:429159-Hanusia_phi.AAC.1